LTATLKCCNSTIAFNKCVIRSFVAVLKITKLPGRVWFLMRSVTGSLLRMLTVVTGDLPRCTVTADDVRRNFAGDGHFIASAAAQPGSCGSETSPWVVKAQPGQKLRFTLHDFAVQPAAAGLTSNLFVPFLQLFSRVASKKVRHYQIISTSY